MPPSSWLLGTSLLFMLGAAAAVDTAQCAALNQTYQETLARCRNASSTDYLSGRTWCAVPSCADTIKAAANRKLQGCEIELTCLPLSYCTDPCLRDLEAYQKSYGSCNEANITLLVDNCMSCQRMFPQYAAFQASCQVLATSSDAYVANFYNLLGSQFDYCLKQFPAAGLVFPTPHMPDQGSSFLTTGIIGGVGGVLLCVLGFLIYQRWRRRSGLSTCQQDASTVTTLSRYHPYSSNTPGQGRALVKKASSAAEQSFMAHQDIRFDPEMIRLRIPQEEILNATMLASGGYGVVYRATVQGQEVAMKQLLPSKAKDTSATAEFMREIRLCARLDHPNIVRFLGVSWSTLVDLAVLSEFMPKGDVRQLLQAERLVGRGEDRQLHWKRSETVPFTSAFPTTKTKIALEVAKALSYLHALEPQIIHRDLKAKNVLLSGSYEAKLSDFGISRITAVDETMTGNVGTMAWIAPEVLTGARYTTKADIYSFGAFLSELDTLETPYSTSESSGAPDGFSNARIALLVSQGQLQPGFTGAMPRTLLKLAQQCLSFQDSERPTALEIIDTLDAFLQR